MEAGPGAASCSAETDGDGGSSAANPCTEPHAPLERWEREQERLRGQLILHDDFPWRLPPALGAANPPDTPLPGGAPAAGEEELRYVAGVDVSFRKEAPSDACAALVVWDVRSMAVAYEAFRVTCVTEPYVAGFLAFRECPVLVQLLEELAAAQPDLMPQVILVDGNGVLHPRGFGLACHLGVSTGIPTIGVGKSVLHVDGLTAEMVKAIAADPSFSPGVAVPLVGNGGSVLGAALRSTGGSRPIMVSVGHRVSLDTALAVVRLCSIHRVPEPIRQADLRSRAFLRGQGCCQLAAGEDAETG